MGDELVSNGWFKMSFTEYPGREAQRVILEGHPYRGVQYKEVPAVAPIHRREYVHFPSGWRLRVSDQAGKKVWTFTTPRGDSFTPDPELLVMALATIGFCEE